MDVGVVPSLELPPPLERGHALLSPERQTQFDVDAFLCSRSYGQDVHSILKELRTYSHTLQDHLVQVIHAKYRDFVELATMLNADSGRVQELGEDSSMEAAGQTLQSVRATLGELNEHILQEKEASAKARQDKVRVSLTRSVR